VTLTDAKGRRRSIKLKPGQVFQTARGGIAHDDLLGGPDGVVVTSELGASFLALRPLLGEFTVTMPRGAAIVYPKDAAHIVGQADVFPGARVVEAGAGSGALTCALLRAIGPSGRLISYERRADFAEIAERNVTTFFGERPESWDLRVDDLATGERPGEVDRVVLDMVAPWECVAVAADALVPGGVLCSYVATTTQLGRTMDTIRAHTGFTEPEATELIVRSWHAEGLAIRPGHAGIGHTGFLIFTRRLAPGVVAPTRKRRPAAGAYGPDYAGPRPPGVPDPTAE